MLIVRVVSAFYCLALTTLLLMPDPWALFGIRTKPKFSSAAGVHFVCFAVLGFLLLASRLPLSRTLVIGFLIGYATLTELAQWLFSSRGMALPDLCENLLGLATAIGVWSLVQRRGSRRPASRY